MKSALPTRIDKRRTVWTTTTFVSESAHRLIEQVQSSFKPDPSSVTAYAVSKNVPFQLHSSLYSAFASTTSVGCVSEVMPSSVTKLVAPALDNEEPFSVSIATFTPTGNNRAIAFQSSLQGRPNIALGREIKPQQSDEGDLNEAGLQAFLSGKTWGFGEDTNVQNGETVQLQELEGVEPEQVTQVVFFTADRVQAFLGALSRYPQAAKIGLVGSSTPFHSPSGSPYTLFYDSESASTGAVGIAIVGPKRSASVTVDYAGLQQLGQLQKVTSSKGNIVLTLSEQNAARMLLDLVSALPKAELGQSHERAAEKEKEFYAAVFDYEPTTPLDLTTARHVSPIMSGDPSRGAISIETEEEVKAGYYVAFLHRPSPSSSASAAAPSVLKPLSANSINVISSAPSHTSPQDQSDISKDGSVSTVEAFVSASENGIILSKQTGESGSWVCKIDGVGAKLG
ncbi:hypothetical protein ACM66B_006737 [Microbotryomycetes sp. NB124-2]